MGFKLIFSGVSFINYKSAVSAMILNSRTVICAFLVWVATSSCFIGEYYNRNNDTCEQCDISCETCSSGEGCSTCYDQMYLSPVGNKVLCKVCYEVNLNCQSCLSSQKCSSCSSGYYVNSNNTCSPCSQHTSNCIFCNQNGTAVLCITCNFTFNLVNGRCVSANNSSTANNNTTQVQGTAQKSSGVPQNSSQKGSSEGQGGQNTSSCLSNEVQVSGVCVLAIPFCIEYNLITKKCKECTKDCILSDFGYCVPLILLISNNNGTNAVNSEVSIVASDLKMQKNVSAADCGQNQYFWYDQCVTIGSECVQRAQNGTCEGCIRGFRLQRGLCIQIPPINKSSSNSASQPTKSPASQQLAIQPSPASASNNASSGSNLRESQSSDNCKSPCLRCSSNDPETCITCVQGFTTVDAFPGKCFVLN